MSNLKWLRLRFTHRHNSGRVAKGILSALCLILIAGCSDSDNDGQKADHLKITSYNAGLAPTFVPLTEERVKPNIEALQNHDADMICLQEVWMPEHMEEIADALKERYPYQYSVLTEQTYTEEPACTEDEIQGMVACAESKCDGITGDDFTQCVIASCLAEFGALQAQNSVCAQALLAKVGSDLDTAVAAVTQPSGIYAFDGANGLMLLSRYKMKDTQFLDMEDISTSNHRAALFATVTLNGQNHYIGCTHLTADLGDIPYTGNFSGWNEEAVAQSQRLTEFADAYAGDAPVFLAGDFNCSFGNATLGVSEDVEQVCSTITQAGFMDPVSEQLPCSFCSDNLINTEKGAGGEEGSWLLDHVFYKNISPAAPVQAKLVMNQEVDLDTEDGGQIPVNLSDHYGVQIDIPLK